MIIKRKRYELLTVILSLTLILGIAIHMQFSSGRFDFEEFDQKHHTCFKEGYRYTRENSNVPGVYRFQGAPKGYAYSFVTVYDADRVVAGTERPGYTLLDKKESSLLSLPAAVILFKENHSEKDIYNPSYRVFFARKGSSYDFFITTEKDFAKNNSSIDESDNAYIEEYLSKVFVE